jgi:Uma2 family endonuclease
MATVTTPNLKAFLADHLADHLPASFYAPGLSEEQFLALFEKYPDFFLEYTTDGMVLLMPPTDPESAERVNEVGYQLTHWTKAHGGHVIGANGLFFLPNGARRGPDAAWWDDARWQATKNPKTRYPMFAPDFVIEVRSPAQRARPLREKMTEYIENGVKLGWLIDPIDRSVTIYRPEREPEVLANPKSVSGEGPIEGFVLNLDRIL